MPWTPAVASPADFVFFEIIFDYLHAQIQLFGIALLGRAMRLVGMLALTVVTLWVMIQGYRLATGQSRQAAMTLVVDALKAALIITVATSAALFGTDLHTLVAHDLANAITHLVTGSETSAQKQIDTALGWMQMGLTSVDVLDTAQDMALHKSKMRALWMIGLGMGGPALVGGSLLLLYQVAIALFVGLGPIFILCLLFPQTRHLFQQWLWYGVGTLFSLATLAAMTAICLDLVIRVAAAFWANAVAGKLLGNMTEGVSSLALQQGGLGLILTTLIISAPPMAAMFFRGVLGQFSAYNAMGAGGAMRSPQPSHMLDAPGTADAPLNAHVQPHAGAAPALDVVKTGTAFGLAGAPTAAALLPMQEPAQQDYAQRRAYVEQELRYDIQALEQQESWWLDTRMAAARGAGVVPRPVGAVPIAENGGIRNALDIASDPFGILEPLIAQRAAMAEMNAALSKKQVDDFRALLIKHGVPNVPDTYEKAYLAGGNMVDDYAGTMRVLGQHYRQHLHNQRMTETWGPDWKDLRIGKSRMTPDQFEARVFDLHQKAVDAAHKQTIEAVTRGVIPVTNGWARTIGFEMDSIVRYDLKQFAIKENLPEGMRSKLYAVNRSLGGENNKYGIPDLRLGVNLRIDTSLSRKDINTQQIRMWNESMPGITIIVRPTEIGGAYALPAIRKGK